MTKLSFTFPNKLRNIEVLYFGQETYAMYRYRFLLALSVQFYMVEDNNINIELLISDNRDVKNR